MGDDRRLMFMSSREDINQESTNPTLRWLEEAKFANSLPPPAGGERQGKAGVGAPSTMPSGDVLFDEDGVEYREGDFVACNPSPGLGSLPYIGEVPAMQRALP